MAPVLISTGLADLLPMVRGGDPASHISAIIRYMCVKLGHFDLESGANPAFMELGSAWEDTVAAALANRYQRAQPDRFTRIDEMVVDGLHGNMDLMDVLDWAVIEMKLTRLSARHEPDSLKFWKYWTQLKAYCYMATSNIGRLHVCHLEGNYEKDPTQRQIIYNVWEDRFSDQELLTNWRMLLTHGAAMRADSAWMAMLESRQ